MQGGEITPARRGITSFFQQFALRTCQWIFAGVNFSSGQFVKIPVQWITVLAFQHQFTVIQQRNDDDRTGVGDVLAHHLLAVGQADLVCVHLQQMTIKHAHAADLGFGEIKRWFGHEDKVASWGAS